MITVVLVGTGNVAQNLFQAFKDNPQVNLKQVVGRNQEHLSFASSFCSTSIDFKQLEIADIYLLAISDDAISDVANKLKIKEGLIVHTSGATTINVLENSERTGVFYPLQTFTKGKLLSFHDIPICIEARSEKDYVLLENLGFQLSNKVVRVSSEERQKLHVAAVFANNFTNYMYTLAEEICVEHELDFNLLKPLVLETASKLNQLSPKEAQTGPAIRGDQKTLHTHLAILKNNQKRELYTLLSNAIKHTHGEEL